MTGNITTRNRSTRPASSSERHSLRLPMVRIDRSPFSFISRTASAGSPVTSVEFSHSSGSVRVLEKTTFERPPSTSVPGSPAFVKAYMSRLGVRSHQDQVVPLGVLAQPGKVLRPFHAPPARPALGGRVPVERGDEVDDKLRHLHSSLLH